MFTKMVFVFLLVLTFFTKSIFANVDPSNLSFGSDYTFDDSNSITWSDDLLGDGKKEKVVFYSSNNKSFVIVVDLTTNKVLANERIADDLDENRCRGSEPSGVYKFDENENKKYIVSFCRPGATIGEISVYSWDGKSIKRLAAPWKIEGDINTVSFPKLPKSDVVGILINHLSGTSDFYVMQNRKFVLSNDSNPNANNGDEVSGSNADAENILRKAHYEIGGSNNFGAISLCNDWLNQNEKSQKAYSLKFHFLKAKALQASGDENAAIAEYETYFKGVSTRGDEIIAAYSYEALGDFYWRLNEMAKAKIAYGKTIDMLKGFVFSKKGGVRKKPTFVDKDLQKINLKIKEINETSSDN